LIPFKKILLVNRGEKRRDSGIEHAANLASMTGSSLLVVGAIRTGFALPGLGKRAETLNKMAVERVLDGLERLVRPARKQGVSVITKVLVGSPFIEVIKQVVHDEYDLVMIPARRSTNLRRMLFGSTEMHLIRKCPCPVWVIKPKEKVPCTRILAAVGPELSDPVEQELDDNVIRIAASLANLNPGHLHIVHAWHLYGETLLRGAFANVKQSEVDRLRKEERARRKKELSALQRRLSLNGQKQDVHLLEGSASGAIVTAVKRKRIHLLVMGTVSRGGIAGVLIGNTAEEILGEVDCSVLTLKPPGFVTPVKV
jgi:nucleotide-binding universal stress UspA family protein